jgi:YYY domain-containing protein
MGGVKTLAYEFQLLAVLGWLALLIFLQLSVWPALRPVLREFAYPLSFPASLLSFTLLSWYCGLLHLPIQAALLPFFLLFLFYLVKRQYSRKDLSGQWRWALVFFVFFLFMLELRFVNPSISYAEKFMDHAFLASIMRVPVVPPLDPWFSGGYLNVYYYLGYWMFGALGVISGIPSTVVFNLALPTVLANAAVGMFALAHLLTARMRWLPLLTFLVVNPSFVWQLLQGKALGSVLWDSTRTVPNAINEYPIFSFVWGDVHAHVISLFNQVFLIFMLVYALLRWKDARPWERLAILVLTALSLGSMPIINTWDVILYAPITVLFGIMIWYQSGFHGDIPPEGIYGVLRRTITRILGREKIPTDNSQERGLISRSWSYLVLVPLLSVLIYLPYYLQVNTSGIQGIGLVHTPTPVPAFLLVHGIFIVLFLLYLAKDIIKQPLLLLTPVPFVLAGFASAGIAALPLGYFLARKKKDPAELIAIIGLFVIIICEFFYLKDNMGETYYRMNTIFKFYLPAWILMGASGFAMAATLISPFCSCLKLTPGAKRAALVISVIVLLLLPVVTPFENQYRDMTLDGLAYLAYTHPGDAEAVKFLRSLDGVSGIVEAEGGDYTYYSRISSFTGIPSIIGMPFHEYMWRADGWHSERVNDIRIIYEEPTKTRELMTKYNVTLLYVGDPERERYKVRVKEAGLPFIYNRSGVQIYTLSD